jgi:hypothetical protein
LSTTTLAPSPITSNRSFGDVPDFPVVQCSTPTAPFTNRSAMIPPPFGARSNHTDAMSPISPWIADAGWHRSRLIGCCGGAARCSAGAIRSGYVAFIDVRAPNSSASTIDRAFVSAGKK